MRKAGAVAVTTAVTALTVAAGASAVTIKLKGEVVGQPKSNVQVTVRKEHGDLTKITKLVFKRVAATCEDGTGGAINGSDPRDFSISGKNFTRKTRVLGPGIDHGYFKSSGRFRRGGKALTGKVRFAFKTTAGVGCGTGNPKFKAAKGKGKAAAAAVRVCPALPAQAITKRRNISCERAQRVYEQHANQGLECRSDGAAFEAGWKFVGIGRPGEIVEAKAKKGSKSFHYGGGGVC